MGHARQKLSNLERVLNALVVAMFLFTVVLSFAVAAIAAVWNKAEDGGLYAYYLPIDYNTGRQAVKDFGTAIILGQTFIPISLPVTMEVCKVLQGVWILMDIEMFHVEYDASDPDRADPDPIAC